MQRRTVLTAAVVALAGCSATDAPATDDNASETGNGGAGGGDDRTDTGGLFGFSHIERLEWGEYGNLTLVFSDDHGSDFITISHALNADDADTAMLRRESPGFGGELSIDFAAAVSDDGRDFPSMEFAIDYYTGDDLGVVVAVDEHLGTDEFEVPDSVDMSGKTTISG